MRGIKIPQQEFALKMQGGLMREGGRICGTLRGSCARNTKEAALCKRRDHQMKADTINLLLLHKQLYDKIPLQNHDLHT